VTLIFVIGPRNSISKLETRVDNIDQIITQLEANNTQLIASLNDSLNKQTTYFTAVEEQLTASIQTVEKNQSILNNDILTVKSMVQNEVTQRSASITTLTNSINSLNTSLSNLSQKVSDLEEDLDTEDSGKLYAEVKSTDLEIDEGDSSFSGTTVIRVTNDTSYDIEDIELAIYFEADEELPDVSSIQLTGGSITWTFEGQDSNILYFSSSDFDLDEDDYRQMTLTLVVYFDYDVTEYTEFEVYVSISDYDY
jgi:flagellar biosynthesis chaperone FliJ